MRKTSVLLRSSSGEEPIRIVLPTPFSQMTYCEKSQLVHCVGRRDMH